MLKGRWCRCRHSFRRDCAEVVQRWQIRGGSEWVERILWRRGGNVMQRWCRGGAEVVQRSRGAEVLTCRHAVMEALTLGW